MNRDYWVDLFSFNSVKYTIGVNLLFFGTFVIYYDVLEMPNTIGYVTLGLAGIASLLYFLNTQNNVDAIIKFAIPVWFSLGIIAHNINFLIAFDYRGQYVIESKRPIESFMESWSLRLDNNEVIVLRVSDVSSGDGINIDLKKGLFGVYFGTWTNEG